MSITVADRFAEAQTEWKEPNRPGPTSLWVESQGKWTLVESYNDYTDALLPLVKTGKPAVLEMYGTLRPLDEEGEPTDETMRCRVIFAIDGDDHNVLVQRADGESFSDEGAEGAFMEMYHEAKWLAEMGR